MKPEKAAEYYSAYYENSLPSGLKSQFEDLLSNNPRVASDYADFVASLDSIDFLAEVPVAVPGDLHEKILRRIDRAAYDEKQSKKAGWFGDWRLTLLGGLAGVAILSGVIAMNRPSAGGTAEASLAGIAPNRAIDFSISESAGVFTVKAVTAKAEEITVVRQPQGTLERSVMTEPGRPTLLEFTGESLKGETLMIQGKKDKLAVWIAFPSASSSAEPKTAGTLREFASTFATRVQRPVFIQTTDPERSINWRFTGNGITDIEFTENRFSIEVKSAYVRLRD